MSSVKNAEGPEAAPPSGFRHRWVRGRKSAVAALILAMGTSAGVGGLSLASGCQAVGPIVTSAAVQACMEIIRRLFNLPLDHLPPGFVPCGPAESWQHRDGVTVFCFYCSEADPYIAYMQMDCQGPFHPLKMRPMGSSTQLTYVDAMSIESMSCEEQLMLRAQSSYDRFHGRLQTKVKSPNNRMLPDPSAYPSLEVRIDGQRLLSRTDFPVRFGETIELHGTVDEVAHYAMTAGVNEITFRDGSDLYEVFVNPRFSAKLVFKNGVCIEKGLLFAPLP